jgi:hypothetical protein
MGRDLQAIEYVSLVRDLLYHRAVRAPLFALVAACKVAEPPAGEAFADRFERDEVGRNYLATGAGYRIADGALSAHGARNHPLWLVRAIPRDVRIELDCWSTERRGDLKIELFGDGRSFDPDGGGYVATGYELIFGGWHNQRSMIARLDEHGRDNVQRTDIKVEPNRRYHWKIERKGSRLRWYVTWPGLRSEAGADDAPFLELDDPAPLEGEAHAYLGFNNWETDTWFDNLVIAPL